MSVSTVTRGCLPLSLPGGGRLAIVLENVVVDEAEASVHGESWSGRYVKLSVSDTGCGMDGATRERVFEPFVTTKPVGKGTGLGLSAVFGIMKQAGGRIEVSSEVGKGSVFGLYFPQADGTSGDQISDIGVRSGAGIGGGGN